MTENTWRQIDIKAQDRRLWKTVVNAYDTKGTKYIRKSHWVLTEYINVLTSPHRDACKPLNVGLEPSRGGGNCYNIIIHLG